MKFATPASGRMLTSGAPPGHAAAGHEPARTSNTSIAASWRAGKGRDAVGAQQAEGDGDATAAARHWSARSRVGDRRLASATTTREIAVARNTSSPIRAESRVRARAADC